MSQFDRYVLLADLDGTLLTSHKTVSREDREAIRIFTENGGMFGAATGRSPQSASRWLSGLPVNGPCVHLNGSLIWDPIAGKPMMIREMDKAPLIPVLEWVLANLTDTVAEIFTADEGMFQISNNKYLDPYVEEDQDPYRWSTLDQVVRMPWVKILMYNSHEKLLKVYKKLAEAENGTGAFNYFFTLDIFLEVTPAGTDKGSAVHWLCHDGRETLGGRKIIAAGDFDNDVTMLREADCGAAVGNAQDVAKEAADIIVADNDHSPMADIIRKLAAGEIPFKN
ncbi:MAG: HAD-IIB family hydrolase [Lachnospiraceae bacterium]|jgi:Cof subfamily protein (haloacid dehalogenase superfamily)